MKGRDTFIFLIRQHVLHVTGDGDRWVTTLDGRLIEGWFAARSEAWTAGVNEADRLDRTEAAAPGA